jgi:hypothetical protein
MDGGNTWKEFSLSNSRFKPKPVVGGASSYQGDHISLLAVDNTLYALWMGDYSGVYQVWYSVIDMNVLDVNDERNSHVNSFALFQNYPNPFNNSTIINYSIKEECFVSLKIYDVMGKEVDELVNEIKIPGQHKAKFNADNLPSGIYFYNLETENFNIAKKMILLK